MMTGPLAGDWQRLAGLMGGELALLVAGLALLQLRARSASSRRALWRMGLAGAAVFLGCEVAGGGRLMAGWRVGPSATPEATVVMSSNLEPTLAMPAPVLEARNRPVLPERTVGQPQAIWWPAWLWLGGAGLVLGRMALARAVFALALRRRREACPPELAERVRHLAGALGLRRSVKMFALPGLPAPVSYGVFRPAIAFSPGFSGEHDSASRDVMIVHELAHVAARDGFWHALADIVVAVLWWHPVVWWMRRELFAASELAADEASVVVENGPQVRAECLVTMARRLVSPLGGGWQGIQGGRFRSGLGRRVERLLGSGIPGDHGAHGAQEAHGARGARGRPAWRRWAGSMAVMSLSCGIVFLGARVAHRGEGRPLSWEEAWDGSIGRLLWTQVAATEVAGVADVAAAPVLEEVPDDRLDWKPWSREAVAAARAEGRPVLVHFTADWCLTGMANERTALDVPTVRARLRDLQAVTLRADWTLATNAAIEAELNLFNRPGVPLTLVYPADATLAPEVLPELLTPEHVLKALADAQAGAKPPPTAPTQVLIEQVSTTLFEAKGLLDADLLTEAEAKLKSVLQRDPKNEAAGHYLALIEKRRGPAAIAAKRAAFNNLLDGVLLESFGGTLPLSEMVGELSREIRAADPTSKGLNFIIDPGLAGEDLMAVDLMAVVVQVQPPLRRVSVRQILDAMVQGAGGQIRFAVEDYAVVFSRAETDLAPSPPPLHTRWFKLDPTLVAKRLGELLGTEAGFAPGANQSTLDVLLFNLRKYLKKQGVSFSEEQPPSGPGRQNTSTGRQLFLNDRLGMLMVRATLQELEITERLLLQIANSPPPQVLIEAKFCEVPIDAWRARGMENLLTSIAGRSTNSTHVGVITSNQSARLTGDLQQSRGVNWLTAPRLTTLSGRQAQIKVVNVRRVLTGFQPGPDYQGVTIDGGAGEPKPVSEQFESGPVLDVVPHVLNDGVTIQLSLSAGVKEFIGYDPSSEDPRPIFRHRSMTASARIPDGGIAVLYGGTDELGLVGQAAMPGRDLRQALSEPFRRQVSARQESKLIVFVMARIIDAAGNPVSRNQ